MLYSILFFTSVLFLRPTSGDYSQCHDYGFNECTQDPNAQIGEINMGTQEKCHVFCELYDDCQFYAFRQNHPINDFDCHIYGEPFNTYIDHCNIRYGPRDEDNLLSNKCLSPAESTCDIEQNENCNLLGHIIESNLVTPRVEICQELCNINSECKYWEWNRERETCNLYDSEETHCNIVFGTKGECTTQPTNDK